MEGLIGTIVLAAVVIGGVYGLTAWYDRRDAKQQDDNEDRVLHELKDDAIIKAAIRRRTESNQEREINAIKKRAENQFRVDDEQWRDWN
jgi:hypothetical protein